MQTGQKPALLHMLPCCHPRRMLQDPLGLFHVVLGARGKQAHPRQEFILHLL